MVSAHEPGKGNSYKSYDKFLEQLVLEQYLTKVGVQIPCGIYMYHVLSIYIYTNCSSSDLLCASFCLAPKVGGGDHDDDDDEG